MPNWKDTLIPGASRVPLPSDGVLAPGFILDTFGTPTERNDWVYAPGGGVKISGSGVDPEIYGMDAARASWTTPESSGLGPSSGLMAALASQQGKAATAKAYADAGLSSLYASMADSKGPTIGGHDIESVAAMPFLSALGQKWGDSEAERERRRALELGFGANKV